MARLQILELPEGASDERAPFVLVIDQYEPTQGPFGAEEPLPLADDLAEKIGARTVLVFETTVDIPANETPVGPDGYPVRLRVEGDFEQFREQVQAEATAASNVLAGTRHTAEQYSDRPPHQYSDGGQQAREDGRAAFARSIGMSPLSSWNDMGDQIRQIRDHLGNAETRLKYAREALIKDGYFTADEIGPDIAPRLTEWLSHHRQYVENFQSRALAAQERIRGILAEFCNALGLDNDEAIDVLAAARDMRQELDQARETIRSVRHIHRGDSHQGRVVCAECSALDDQGTTDNSPVAHPCDTVKALDAKPEVTTPELADG